MFTRKSPRKPVVRKEPTNPVPGHALGEIVRLKDGRYQAYCECRLWNAIKTMNAPALFEGAHAEHLKEITKGN